MIGATARMIGATAPMTGADGPMIGATAPMTGADGPMIGAIAPMTGADGPMIGATARMTGADGPMIGADGPMTGADGPVTPAKLSFAPATRPLSPQINTDEIGDAQVTPAKLSFTPVTRPLTPPATPAEMEDRFSIAQNVLLFSNLNNVPVSNTLIDCAPYVPVGTKYAIVVMTHTGISSITRGYDGILYVTRADLPTAPAVQAGLTNPLYRLDTDAKDFTNYLSVLMPLDSNRKFVTSVYRVGVTTSAELYLVGYIR